MDNVDKSLKKETGTGWLIQVTCMSVKGMTQLILDRGWFKVAQNGLTVKASQSSDGSLKEVENEEQGWKCLILL